MHARGACKKYRLLRTVALGVIANAALMSERVNGRSVSVPRRIGFRSKSAESNGWCVRKEWGGDGSQAHSVRVRDDKTSIGFSTVGIVPDFVTSMLEAWYDAHSLALRRTQFASPINGGIQICTQFCKSNEIFFCSQDDTT